MNHILDWLGEKCIIKRKFCIIAFEYFRLNLFSYLNFDGSVGVPVGDITPFFLVHVQNKLRNKMKCKVLYYPTVSVVQESGNTLLVGSGQSLSWGCIPAVVQGCQHHYWTFKIHFQIHLCDSKPPTASHQPLAKHIIFSPYEPLRRQPECPQNVAVGFHQSQWPEIARKRYSDIIRSFMY